MHKLTSTPTSVCQLRMLHVGLEPGSSQLLGNKITPPGELLNRVAVAMARITHMHTRQHSYMRQTGPLGLSVCSPCADAQALLICF
jgi:hypothetical protein